MTPPESSELCVVIPVFNEERNIPALISDWRHCFNALSIRYRFLFIDDGSTDGSLPLLRSMALAADDMTIISQANAGHGPAIRLGYEQALDASWVFQIDSDHHLDTHSFARLWENRGRYDLLVGERAEKNASRGRKWISLLSTLTVRILYGRGIRDVNSPYRLIRSLKLRDALGSIPAGSFAPNVLLTSWFVRKKAALFTTAVGIRENSRPRKSSLNAYFIKGSLRAFFQTALFRIRS